MALFFTNIIREFKHAMISALKQRRGFESISNLTVYHKVTRMLLTP